MTWEQVRVGLLILVALSVLSVGVFLVGDTGNVFGERYRLVTLVRSASGLVPGAAVQLAGQTVGQVDDIRFIPPDERPESREAVAIWLAINVDVRDQIREDSRAQVRTQGLLGDRLIDIRPGSSAARILQPGDTVASAASLDYDALLAEGFPSIHAVGRASSRAPRLIDLRWGDSDRPRVTLVGKGVCFDTGGLDIKPAAGMLLMKKDMGGAAHVLGLARMIMGAGLPVSLRVLIAAVENSISGNAYRPGDVVPTRKGLSVEIGNTDAEGRMVLCDALALADEEAPDLLIDMATLTGAARVALGPELPAMFCDDEETAGRLHALGMSLQDPVWRLPFWDGYEGGLKSSVADLNHISSDGFAGSIYGALFLRRFVDEAAAYIHMDVFSWNKAGRPGRAEGGETQSARALFALIAERFPSD